MRFTSAFLVFALFAPFAMGQNIFRGPIQLKVWKHWQASWNVEDVTGDNFAFELIRQESPASLVLNYRTTEPSLRAEITCDRLQKVADWAMAPQTGSTQSAQMFQNSNHQFQTARFTNPRDCLDLGGQRIITNIRFRVVRTTNNQEIFAYAVNPMYVRGPQIYRVNNPIDPHSAHAGRGQISVGKQMTAEDGNDFWDGILVKLSLGFVDLNRMLAGGVIGLHRHERNQEAYLIQSGQGRMLVGVAQQVPGSNRREQRRWNSAGANQETDVFDANGGYIEQRDLGPGDIAVIVPNPNNSNTIYFHGIEALTDLTFSTMGTKN